jgi:L-seryl-tRNA(Ser) seleniumtransferase
VATSDFSKLPSVTKLIEAAELSGFAHSAAVEGARLALDEARANLNGGLDLDSLIRRAAELARSASATAYPAAINCSGAILNTGLGRARLAKPAAEALAAGAGSHSILELDPETGRRGDRQAGLSALLCKLTGAEAAMVVNNNAAAVLLTISTLAAGKEVLLSRGQSVEIGGSFRMPDVVRSSGAKLVDVGCTNRTRAADYENACTEETGAILRCHPSNFTITGFAEEPSVAELAAVAKARGLALIDDAGSGCLVRTEQFGLPHEATLAESVAAGSDVVTASGDKLLGGPQAGIILGRKDLVDAIRKNPLARAVRINKQTAAALEATLRLYVESRQEEIPTIRYISRTGAEVRGLANQLSKLLSGRSIESQVEPATCEVGGGSLPGVQLSSWRIALDQPGPDEISKRLRMFAPAIVGYIHDGKVCLDMRTVEVEELAVIAAAVERATT